MTRRSLVESAASSGLIENTEMRDFIFSTNTIAPHVANGAKIPESIPEKFISGESRVKLSEIAIPEYQVRRYFDKEKLDQLTLSVKKYGIVGALLLRPIPPSKYNSRFKYELVAGGRRYRAGVAAEVVDAPAIIREMTDEDVLELSAIENLQREDLNLFEETEASLQIVAVRLGVPLDSVVSLLYQMDNFKKGKLAHNPIEREQAQVIESTFQELGRLSWDSFVSHRLPLLKLPDEVKLALQEGKIEYTKARAIASLKDEADRQQLLETAIAGDWSLSQIKDQVKTLKPDPKENRQSDVKIRLDYAYKHLKQAKVWQNEKKRQKLEKLLSELEGLLL